MADYHMRPTDGITLLAQARTAAPHAARILMTAYDNTEVAARASDEAQVSSFFPKSRPPAELVEATGRILSEHRISSPGAPLARGVGTIHRSDEDGGDSSA